MLKQKIFKGGFVFVLFIGLLFVSLGLSSCTGISSDSVTTTTISTTLAPDITTTTLVGATTTTTVSTPTTTVAGATTTTTTTTTVGGGLHGLTNVFFLHHSTGANLIREGNARTYFNNYNSSHGTSFAFWDQGYIDNGIPNESGLRTPSGVVSSDVYAVPDDNTNPDGLATLWTTSNSARTNIMTNHQVIAFKSCFIALDSLDNDGALTDYKNYYLSMRTYFDANTTKLFVVVTPPPKAASETTVGAAGYARQFANWLKSTSSGGYLAGSHPNIVCFDLFNYLANPTTNMLQGTFESGDMSHPNAAANGIVAPIFSQFLIDAALSY